MPRIVNDTPKQLAYRVSAVVQFAEGIYFNLPREGAPEYVKGSVSFKVADAVAFLQKHENKGGYVNIDLKVSQAGKAYAELNSWQLEKPEGRTKEHVVDAELLPSGGMGDDDGAIPF